jgi:hypothetical protein
MKAVTVTAILALIVGIPLVLRRCRALHPTRSRINQGNSKDQRLYDIDDFIS